MRRGEDGFTLAEMLVVLAILALTVVMVLPASRRSLDVQELNVVTQSLAASLRRARFEAIGQNREAALIIDLERRTAGLATSGSEVEIPKDIALDIVTARGDIAAKSAAFRFFPDGTATGGHILLTRDGEARRIAVQWLTGRVAVETP